MISYPVLDEQQEREFRKVLKPGVYKFECELAEMSQKPGPEGEPQLILKLKVWDELGNIHYVYSWFKCSGKYSYKFKKYFTAVGYPNLYNGHNQRSDFENKIGYVKTSTWKNPDGNEKTTIVDFVPEPTKIGPFDSVIPPINQTAANANTSSQSYDFSAAASDDVFNDVPF